MRAAILCTLLHLAAGQYYGTEVGSLSTNAHDVSGTVYIVDETRLFIKNFNYDGRGPDAFFWVSEAGATGDAPNGQGTLVPDGTGSRTPLYKHVAADVLLTLPPGRTVQDILWLSVWCRGAAANFGHILIPASGLSVPGPQSVTPAATSAQVTSSDVMFLDQRRIRIQDFTNDGPVNDLFFYAGTSNNAPEGRQKLNYETGSSNSLGAYSSKTIDLMLPEGLTVADINWLIVSSESASDIMWRVNAPTGTTVPPYTETGYYGNYLEILTPLDKFGVSGRVYAADSKRIWLRLFNYDGQCDGTYFTIGIKGNANHGSSPNANGTRIPNELGSVQPLTSYVDAGVVLTLPGETVVGELAWLSVWCTSTQEDLGSLEFGAVSVPHTADLQGSFSRLAHSVRSGKVYVLDKRTIRIEEFNYDGGGPDAFFLVGTGSVGPGGIKIPDENGNYAKPARYSDETITLTLPVGLTVDTIDYLSLYCIQYTQNFGQVLLSESEYTVPPYITDMMMEPVGNCEAMSDKFNVGWEIMGENIVFEFIGALDAEDGYMAFGVSGSDSRSAMVGSDPMVVYLDDGVPKVQDYTINGYSLCSGDQGVCPDTAAGGADNLETLSATVRSGVTTVRFRRPLVTNDGEVDKAIPTDRAVHVVWGLGNVNTEKQVTKHTTRVTVDTTINFGREAASNCQPITVGDQGPRDVWAVQAISGMNTKEFTAVIGPSGGRRGYQGITGQVPWGISWYLNGLLIPELTLRRGETYTFKVHGGTVPSNQARYHPLYITNDPLGGYADKTETERQMVRIYAGISSTSPNGTVGSYCELKSGRDAEDFETFDEFKETLVEECDGAKSPGVFTWTPDADTPDLVYYQCYTHNFLGWKIHVVDEYSSGVTSPNPLASLIVITALIATLAA